MAAAKDLKNIHLKELFVLPENYRAIFANPQKSSKDSPLFDLGFGWGDGSWKTPPRGYMYFNRTLGPFDFHIAERDIEKYEMDDVLEYKIEFKVFDFAFSSFLKFLKQWGEQHEKKNTKLNNCFWGWLIGYMDPDDTKYSDEEVSVEVPRNKDYVRFTAYDEAIFFEVLKDISAGLRTLATEHAEDPLYFDYDKSDLKGRDYWFLANHIVTPMVRRGLMEGLAVLHGKIESGETDEPS